jgi:hypothetical protein
MVNRAAEEVEAGMQEDSIHDMIEDMDIEVEEVVLVVEGEAGVVAAAVVEEEDLAAHTGTPMTVNHRMDTSHSQ